jgi:hypothetical protein
MAAPFQYDPNSVALSPERFEELLQCERELKALEGRRMRIVLWLRVRRGPHAYGGDLWSKEVTTDNVPLPDADGVIIWSTDDDPAEGPQWKVNRRYMHADGSWHIELYTMLVDPSSVPLGPIDYHTWHTESEGDPEPLLRQGGWVKYGE